MGSKKCIPSAVGGIPTAQWPAGLHIIAAGVMTGTTTISSNVFNATLLDNIGLQIQWTGSAVGTITVNVSIDNVTFYPLTFNPALTQPAGTAGGYVVDVELSPYPYFKVSYTNASSTGVLDVWLSGKDLN